jgi:hypothetical protein
LNDACQQPFVLVEATGTHVERLKRFDKASSRKREDGQVMRAHYDQQP